MPKPEQNLHPGQLTAAADTAQASQFDWGSIQWFFGGTQTPGAQITFGYVEIEPGRKNPRHYHPNSDEVLYLLEGELDHSLADEVFHLVPGSAIFIAQEVPHDAVNTSDRTARMVVAYPTGDRQIVMLEEGQDE